MQPKKNNNAILWMGLTVFAQIVFNYSLLLNNKDAAKEYYARIAMCTAVASFFELSTHFDIARALSPREYLGPLLYRLSLLSVLGVPVCFALRYIGVINSDYLDILLTYLVIATRPHSIAVYNKSEGRFWKSECLLWFVAIFIILINRDVGVSINFVFLTRLLFYTTQYAPLWRLSVSVLEGLNAVRQYICSRGLSGCLIRGYFNVSWPIFPLIFNHCQVEVVEKIWPIIERICGGGSALMPVLMNSNNVVRWKEVLIIRKFFILPVVFSFIVCQNQIVVWVSIIIYMAFNDSLLMSALLLKSFQNEQVFKILLTLLAVVYLCVVLQNPIAVAAMVCYCVACEMVLYGAAPFNQISRI